MKIKIVLSTGKEIELTQEELKELLGSDRNQIYYFPPGGNYYPLYPVYPWNQQPYYSASGTE